MIPIIKYICTYFKLLVLSLFSITTVNSLPLPLQLICSSFRILTPFFLTSFEVPQVNIPTAITTLHPSPQDELVTNYNRGNSQLMLGNFEEALISFNQCADLNKESADVFLSRGVVLEKLLRWDDAVSDYKRANEIYKRRPFGILTGDDPVVISNIANAETGLLQWENALRDFNKAANLKSDYLAPQVFLIHMMYLTYLFA